MAGLSGMAGPEYRRKAMAGRDNLSAGHRPRVRWQALTGHALVSRHPSGRQGRQGTLRRYITAERQTARQKHDSPPASASLKRAARKACTQNTRPRHRACAGAAHACTAQQPCSRQNTFRAKSSICLLRQPECGTFRTGRTDCVHGLAV